MPQSFKEWWDNLPRNQRPFGTAYEIIARKAWNAALQMAADECMEAEPESGLHNSLKQKKVAIRP